MYTYSNISKQACKVKLCYIFVIIGIMQANRGIKKHLDSPVVNRHQGHQHEPHKLRFLSPGSDIITTLS